MHSNRCPHPAESFILSGTDIEVVFRKNDSRTCALPQCVCVLYCKCVCPHSRVMQQKVNIQSCRSQVTRVLRAAVPKCIIGTGIYNKCVPINRTCRYIRSWLRRRPDHRPNLLRLLRNDHSTRRQVSASLLPSLLLH